MQKYNTVKIIGNIFIILLSLSEMTWAGDLFIDPASPLVAVGDQITLTVTNASGDVRWFAFDGEIQGEGASITYRAPAIPSIAVVTAADSAGNSGTVSVVVMEKTALEKWFSKENANWELYTNRSHISDLLLSDDKMTLWVGTTGGLEERNARNGQLKTIYTNQDGLPDNYVDVLVSDGLRGIWVGTWGGGLAHLTSKGIWEVFNSSDSGLPDNDIDSLVSDGSGGIWVGTDGGGLAHLTSKDIWEVFNSSNSALPDNDVASLVSDGSGGIWVGTSGGGLAHLTSQGIWEVFNSFNSALPENYVNALVPDGSGGIWVGTSGALLEEVGGGLAHLTSQGTWEVFDSLSSDLPDNYVNSIILDGSGGIWVGTSNGLAKMTTQGSFELFYDSSSGLPDNLVYSLLSDGSGDIWVGTSGGLAHMTNQGIWEIFDSLNSDLPDNHVNSVISDGSGGIWMGTSGGLAHMTNQGSVEVLDSSNSDLPDNWVYSLASDGSGGIWVGTAGGLARMTNQGNFEVFDISSSGLPDNCVNALVPDSSGGIWAGTSGGLAHMDSQKNFEVFKSSDSDLPNNFVNSVISDGSGGIWVGTWDGLAHMTTKGNFDVFDNSNSDLLNNWVYALISDNSGGVWAGTWGGGFAHLKSQGTWDVFDTSSSDLPDNYVNALLSDGSGGIWVGTYNSGLAHLTFSSGIIEEEQYLTGGRSAIIIAGGGNSDDNSLWDSTSKISNYTYKMLNKRGFLNTDIHYISPQSFADFNGDGMDDRIVDAPTPSRQLQQSDIQDAFDWAKTKGDLNQPLYIFFTDHGGNNRLQLAKGVYIEAEELNTMLDDYQQTTGNKLILVIDACHSGTLVESLAAPDRAIISSTDDGLAYFDRYDDQSFNYFVTKGLFKGMNFVEAFHYATSAQKKLLGKLSDYATVAGDEPGGYSQEPQYDDSGDGFYSISDEGQWLKQVAINGSVTMADITLQVTPLIDSGMVSGSTSPQILLKAEATLSAGRVERVWAVIRPPQMDIIVDDTGIPLLAFPKANMAASKTEENVWEGSYDGFVYNGEYEVTFYAQDNEGNIESSDSIKLTVADGMDCPPKASLTVNAEKAVYQPGESLTISVTEHLAYGYDLYVALFLPDGRFTALKNPVKDSKGLQQLEYNRIYWGDRWMDMHREMGKPVTVMDIMLPQDNLPEGLYCIYAALIPQGQDLVTAIGKGVFVLGGVCFEVSGKE
ncbi:two-component regulator propeller domain-containing protein [Desulfamplus magnetovallimortis]|nr:two-component regulator propeller domain-containing protein [Desulfamplus magnetovallimortis]